jgi:plasmid stabilization system protein ParE
VKTPRITLSDLAEADILEQADWYAAQANPKLAQRWEKAVTSVLLQLSQRPGAGSPGASGSLT